MKLNVNDTSESSGPPAAPAIALYCAKPFAFAAWPFDSGVPTVSWLDASTGGLQDADASGGPCVRFGAVQAW